MFSLKIRVLLGKYFRKQTNSLHDSKISSFISIKLLLIFLYAPLTAPFHCHLQVGVDKAQTSRKFWTQFFFLLALQFTSKLKQDVIFHPLWTISCLEIRGHSRHFCMQIKWKCIPVYLYTQITAAPYDGQKHIFFPPCMKINGALLDSLSCPTLS